MKKGSVGRFRDVVALTASPTLHLRLPKLHTRAHADQAEFFARLHQFELSHVAAGFRGGDGTAEPRLSVPAAEGPSRRNLP